MEGIPYPERASLGGRVPEDGQQAVMARIPQFAQAVVDNALSAPQGTPESLKTVVFNIERGMRFDATVDFLQTCPELQNIDLILANELDDGCVRSGCQDVSANLAKALGMNYAFGLEFIELANPDDPKGFHGNAIFSRYPIKWAEVLRLPEENNWYFDRQRRIGGRLAILALLDVGGREVGAVCVHLENRTGGAGRGRQMEAILRRAAGRFPDQPVVIGGDFNTNTFDGRDVPAFLSLFAELKAGAAPRDVALYEPVLPLAERFGFDYRAANVIPAPTRRKPMHNAEGDVLSLQLDWLFTRGFSVAEKGMVSTLLSDCGWKRPGGALDAYTGAEISDHNAIWARLGW